METAAAVTSGSEKWRSVLTPEQTVSQRSGVRRVDLMRSKASFLQTADAGDATFWRRIVGELEGERMIG